MDLAITVLLALTTVAGGYLGLRLTIYPLPDEPAARRLSRIRYEITFIVLSGLGLLLVVSQGVRTQRSQNAAEKRLQEMYADLRRRVDEQGKDTRNLIQLFRAKVEVPQQQLQTDLAAVKADAQEAMKAGTGLAATQARFVQLLARKSDYDLQAQFINQARMHLANETGRLYTQAATLQPPTDDLQRKIQELQKLDAVLERHLRATTERSKRAQSQLDEVRKILGRNIELTFKTFG